MCGGLIEEMDERRYNKIDIESDQNVFQKQFGVLLRLGNIGRFVTLNLLGGIANLGTAFSTKVDKGKK